MASITYQSVRKVFPDGTEAVTDFDLELEDGELMVFVGPSGCGKSTALRMTAGLEDITSGRLLIDEEVVNAKQPQERDIAMVFQDYALYPHMTVRQNMGFALRMMKLPKDEIRRRVDQAAERLSLTALLDRRPKNLSGGQRQRVAMGRAIVREPKAFLLDEPLSNLDAKLRVQMRAEIAALQRQLGVTTLYVTHDQVEAMTMGDRVAVMRKGELQQVAEPQELYDQPVNLFVGGFIGSPAMNMIEATLARDNGTYVARAGTQAISLDEETLAAHRALENFVGQTITLGIRPEDLEDATLASSTPPERRLHGTVRLTEALGSEIMVHFDVDATPALTDDIRELARDVGDERKVQQVEEGVVSHATLVGRFGARSRVREDDQIEVAVDTRALHFFDPETGLGIYDAAPTTKGAPA